MSQNLEWKEKVEFFCKEFDKKLDRRKGSFLDMLFKHKNWTMLFDEEVQRWGSDQFNKKIDWLQGGFLNVLFQHKEWVEYINNKID